MLNSPLKDSVGSTLTHLVIDGNVAGDFSLLLPLNDTKKSIAKGSVVFVNNNLSLKTPAMEFSKVNGTLNYNNSKIFTDSITLDWRGMPLSVLVEADESDDAYQTHITLDGHWAEKQWQAQLPDILHQYGQGELDWQGELTKKLTFNLNVLWRLRADWNHWGRYLTLIKTVYFYKPII
mgnify:CR=1 FL=1